MLGRTEHHNSSTPSSPQSSLSHSLVILSGDHSCWETGRYNFTNACCLMSTFPPPLPEHLTCLSQRDRQESRSGIISLCHNNNDLLLKCFCSVRRRDRIVFIQLAFSHLICRFSVLQHAPYFTWPSLSSSFLLLLVTCTPCFFGDSPLTWDQVLS